MYVRCRSCCTFWYRFYRPTYNLKIGGAFSLRSARIRFVASFRGEEGENGSYYIHVLKHKSSCISFYIFGSRMYFMVLLRPFNFQFLFENRQKGFRRGGLKLSHGNFEVFRISRISIFRFSRDGGESGTSYFRGSARQLISVYLLSIVVIWDLKK